jgi:hypothetical protein
VQNVKEQAPERRPFPTLPLLDGNATEIIQHFQRRGDFAICCAPLSSNVSPLVAKPTAPALKGASTALFIIWRSVWRRAAFWINHQLKRGEAFEANKINGLLVVSLDANEQFCSDRRCCDNCLTRPVTCKDPQGQEFKKTQSYPKQVYAQLSGPELSVILDVEPMRQGEEECAAALRLLRRMRQKYGPRFFVAAVVDSWYANGPFLKTVVEELGWPIIAALKQER